MNSTANRTKSISEVINFIANPVTRKQFQKFNSDNLGLQELAIVETFSIIYP